MKFIFTNKGEGIIIDEEDRILLEKRTWHIGNDGYAKTRVGRTIILMHRLLLEVPDRMLVDHINGNRHDNRKGNLRICTHTQNMYNRSFTRANKTGYKGVRRHGNKWYAQIRQIGRPLHLGSFSNLEDAVQAYDNKASELHGEFAKLNIRRLE